MNYIDTHCHLNFQAFERDYVDVAQKAMDLGVEAVVIPGADSKSSARAVEVAKDINQKLKKRFAFSAIGIHPIYLEEAKNFSEIASLVKLPEVVAIGECGFDFSRDKEKKGAKEQESLFKKHIKLALKLKKPLIVHNRNADEEILEVLRSQDKLPKMVFHCFSSDWKFAQKIFELGTYISFTGNITYSSKKLKKVVERVSLERVMIETDAPYIIPEPERSKGISRNEPYLVKRVAEKIAQIKELDFEEISSQTTKNAIEFFGLPYHTLGV